MHKKTYRTVWISDIHLGSPNCKAKQIKSFLSSFKADNIFLAGDIIDGWALIRNSSVLSQDHLDIVRTLLTKAKKGTHIYYAVGNHDDFFRKFGGFFPYTIGNISVNNEFEYTTLNNGILWITHGDLYDCLTHTHRWISVLGDIGYTLLVRLNRLFNCFRQRWGYPYWSLSNYIKQKVKLAVQIINNFEEVIATEGQRRGVHGIVCGHIHTPVIKKLGEITYYNTGDWVENCTALVEYLDGRIELIHYDT